MSPWATISRGDLPLDELPGDGVQACMPGRLDIPNDRKDVGRELCCLRYAGHPHALHRAGGTGVPSGFPRALAAARAAFPGAPHFEQTFSLPMAFIVAQKYLATSYYSLTLSLTALEVGNAVDNR